MVDFKVFQARPQILQPNAAFHEWSFPDGTLWTQFYRTGTGYLLRFPGLADFEVSQDGSRVLCFPNVGVTDSTPEHLYRNQVLPLVLGTHGKLVLHGSCVGVASAAIAFLAESGRGKSTLAASFALHGQGFLTDDGLVLEETKDGFLALPSHPSVRLWDDSEEALLPLTTEVDPPLHFTSKSRFRASGILAFCDEPRPLACMYYLGEGSTDSVTIERLSPAEAVIELIKHSFLLDIEDRALLASHFDRVSKLAKLSCHYRLDYPRRYDELGKVRQAIISHTLEHFS